ncbi:MAG: hypothetical protein M0R48_09610 [Candidatus Omnitrophica bacterium]|nr:hypothetical protein [Candidatus Omnitrophota bacterium]
MNVSDIDIGDYFITSALPAKRAFRYGILCKEKEDLKIIFERYTSGEEFALFIKDGQVDTGNWVKTSLNGEEKVKAVIFRLDHAQETEERLQWEIDSVTNDIHDNKKTTNDILKSFIEREL